MYIYKAMSFGAGVQSTCLLLLIKHDPQLLIDAVGHLPSKAYFADTGAERQSTYNNLQLMQRVSPIPIEVVSNGNILTDKRQYSRGFAAPPYFVKKPDGVGMLRRQCTSEFKIIPIEKAIRRAIGLKPKQRSQKSSVALWLGISVDEAWRMRTNSNPMIINIYPLVELGWNRTKCWEYCKSLGFFPTKSSCFFCPYTTDWAELRRNHPADWKKAVEHDRQLRIETPKGVEFPAYLHRSCKPLEEVVVNQGNLFEGYYDDFMNECTGACGL